MSYRNNQLERILGRLDDLDAANLSVLVQRLARERGLLNTVMNSIRDGILVINFRGLVEYANATACALLGFREEDIGKALLWKHVPDLIGALNVGREGRGLPPLTLSRELELNYPEHRYVRFYMTPFEEGCDAKHEGRFTVILSDITDDKLSTEELIENEKISSVMMLAAGVAHELGNPLNSINIHLQLIRRQLQKLGNEQASEKILQAVNVCGGEVERLDGIIKHFLEAIRPQKPELVELNVLEVLTEVLAFLAQEIENLGICAEIVVGNKLPMVRADRNQLKQVFFNVARNAMDAMNEGGQLTISARVDDDYVYVGFADTGAGIDQESMARLFEPYFTTKQQGNGLGLMVCQRIMREHGGQIGIDSQEGKGTLVTLQLPRRNRRVRLLEGGD